MAQPVSSILGDVVKSSRSIAHSDDFEGHKLIQTNSRQLILLDLNILYWCPASRDQIKPLLVQPQISCNASGLAVAKPSFHCGRKAWQVLSVLRLRRLLCLFRLAPSCRLRRLARWCEMAEMVSTATQPRYATAMFQSNQPETFPLSAGETVIFCFGKLFARAAAAAGGSSSSSRRKQQQAAARNARVARVARVARNARSSKEQQGAARSSKEQQQQASSRWAAGEQQVSSSRWAAAGEQQQVSSNK